ncbi:hypothetical protein HYX19_03210 [Candidatus Woesearchaeota archaeon]|nr:hypothetical protein [Candidatus Woesearchaeota archaeon]
MGDKLPGIDLGDWLERANSQGLPPKDVKSGSLYYLNPKNGAVARFFANSGWAGLYPRYSDSGLGVRAARIKEK